MQLEESPASSGSSPRLAGLEQGHCSVPIYQAYQGRLWRVRYSLRLVFVKEQAVCRGFHHHEHAIEEKREDGPFRFPDRVQVAIYEPVSSVLGFRLAAKPKNGIVAIYL